MIDVSSVTLLGGSITPSRAAIDPAWRKYSSASDGVSVSGPVNTVTAAVQSMDAIVFVPWRLHQPVLATPRSTGSSTTPSPQSGSWRLEAQTAAEHQQQQ
jgi:hypothetical protein